MHLENYIMVKFRVQIIAGLLVISDLRPLFSNFFNGGPRWTRTIDLTLIRRAL